MSTHTRQAAVLLSYEDGEVVVTPKDQDRFFISARRAAEACRAAVRTDEIVARFKADLLIPLREWCEVHADLVSACYLGMPDSSVLPIFLIGAGERYDFRLTQSGVELADLLDERGWLVQVVQIPRSSDDELQAIFNVDRSLVVWGSPDAEVA